MVVDCRGLIEFCKAFEQYRNNMDNSLAITDQNRQEKSSHHNTRSGHRRYTNGSTSPSSPSTLCDNSSAAAVDILIFLLVVGACGFLFTPYFKYVCSEMAEILPLTLVFIGEVIYHVPMAYVAGVVLTLVLMFWFWELYQNNARKCNNPKCRGLKKAVEFDIQLESEKCVRALSSSGSSSFSHEAPWKGHIELGHDHKELEAELMRMAPPNGRAVLVFRSPCGCPTARMEVWGPKKPRKSKK